MKWFLITLAIGLAAADKLDRTYLPPPGAQFAGGTLGQDDAPLAPPHHIHSGQAPTTGGQKGPQPNFGINGEPVNFGDKIPKVPVTTTSYAYSRTTTYPPTEGFETTILPINPVTGLPIELDQGNYPYGPSQGGVQNIGSNIQPGFVPQGSTSPPVNYGSPGYDQFADQLTSQYPGQNVITPGGSAQIPGSVYPGQTQGQFQYPGGQAEQQSFQPTGGPNNQHLDHYLGQNVVNPSGAAEIPGGNQGLVQYPGGQPVIGQQGFVPSTGSPINLQPGGNQYGVNYDGAQETYTGQPVNVQNHGETQPTQTSQNQESIHIGGVPSQYPTGTQTYRPSVPTGSENLYHPGSTPTIPSSYYNGVSSTTPLPGVPSSTLAYSTVGPTYRPERPQAAADRNAVILNYENVRTPNSYSYSFDTSNGIHADESGIVDNGTKAQGAYSYIGDDGKVYSVIYTADENGFQPRGDHLPTPPPIPEAIKRVIEQAARDKAAGIVHDGSYDEVKYGDKGHQGIINRHRPQNNDADQLSNKQFNVAQDGLVTPVVGIKDDEYDEGIALDQFNNNLPITGTRKDGKLTARPSLHQNGDISEGNRRVSDVDFDENGVPHEGNNNYGIKNQSSSGRRPISNGVDLPFTGPTDTNQKILPTLKNRRPSERHPASGGVKDVSKTKYPGSNIDVGVTDYTGANEFDNEDQNIEPGNPNISAGENINTSFDSVTGTPIVGNNKQILRQRIKGNRRPGTINNRYNQNKNGRPTQQVTEQNDAGYEYQHPNTKFEQNTFPTRFSSQEVSSTRKPDQHRSDYEDGTTLKPFMTPNVYNKKNKNSQSTPTKYSQKDVNSQSTTLRPFMTIEVTSPQGNSYTDYDDGDDYATDQDISDDIIDSTRAPGKKNGETSRPYQTTHTTSRPQNVPGDQRTRVNQKSTVSPGQRTEHSPGYNYGSTTPMPSHNSRFGSTETSRRTKPHQHRPSSTLSGSTTAVGRPTTQSPPGQSDYKYQTARPVPNYPGDNVGSGYPATGRFTGRRPTTPTPGVSTPQNYYTSTYGPSQGYSSPATVFPTSGYTQGSVTQVPTGTPGSLQSSQDGTFHTGYHYGPPKFDTFNPNKIAGPGSFAPTENFGVFPSTPTGTYQTTYQQGPGIFPSSTTAPTTPGRQGTFIPSQPGTTAPESPFGTYQGNYQNGPSTPNYPTTILSSTPGVKPIFGYPGAQQGTTGYEQEPSRPTFFPTGSPGTVIPSGTTGPSHDYTTTYRPGFQTEDTFVGGPVDGFGRPISTGHDGSHPGFGHPTQGTTGPINNAGPSFGGTDQSTTYPGYDHTKIIGEDFSGPKQPQRYDPKTGYHYK